ncbi:class IIb bacteriocin, lactobin A/cerein 7B family [Pedobacter sp.]
MKNLNLENLGVQEMDARELEDVDGGVFPVWLIGVGIYLFDQREKVKQGLKDALHDLTHI